MKRWKRILFVVCTVVLFILAVNICPTNETGEKRIRAAGENYRSIEVNGVKWKYQIFSVNLSDNPKYGDSLATDRILCAKVSLENTNGQKEIIVPDTIEGYPVYMIENENEFRIGVGADEVTKITIPITVEWIDNEAFQGWKSLKDVKFIDKGKINSTGREISEEEMYLYHIGNYAFSYCESLETMPIIRSIFLEGKSNEVGKGIYAECINLKKAVIDSEKEEVYIPERTFADCNLEEGIKIADTIKKMHIDNEAFAGTKMKKLEISCDCILDSSVFAENKVLNYAKFDGSVEGIGSYIFKGSFEPKEDTKLIFAGEKTELDKNVIEDACPNTVSFINPDGEVVLGKHCILNSKINNIKFENKNVTVKEGGLEIYQENLSKICFGNSDTTIIHDGAFFSKKGTNSNTQKSTIKTIEFQSRKVLYSNLYDTPLYIEEADKDTSIIYGENVEQVKGIMGEYLSGFSILYFENPDTIHDVEFTNYEPEICGYAKQEKIGLDFENIQKNGLILRYEDPEIVNTKGIDLEKLHVYTMLKTGKEIEISTGKIIENGELPDLQNEKGYLLQYKKKLENFEGNMPIRVYYMDTYDEIEIPVVSRKEKGMEIEWSSQYANSLVEGQTVELDKLVKKIILNYNDGTFEEIDFKELEIQNPKVTKGKNKITVYLKKNKNITDSFECEVKENVIVSVIASYQEENVYLGDKVDVNKIQLQAVYLWQDPKKDTKLPCKKISKTVFDLKGINIIRVYYTDNIYSDMVVDVKEAKPIKVNASYKEGYPCYGVNEVIDNKGVIEVSVTYENHEVVSGSALTQPYQINIVSCTEKEVVATVTYEGVKSDTVHIPIKENKIVKISPILEKDSILEGNLVGREQVSGLRIHYMDGTSEMVNLDDLVQEQLQISERYFAVAGKWNTINITYMGISCTASVWGETDEVVALDIQYHGGEVTVGSTVRAEDCKVYLLKKSGKKVQITEGFTLLNPLISVSGETQVYVSYGVYHGSMKVKGVEKSDGIPVSNGTNSPTGIAGKEVFSFHCNEEKVKITTKKSYCLATNKNIKITLKTENIRNVQYQFVTKGQKVGEKNWKNVKNNCISIKNTKEKYGILYIRYTLPNGKTKTVHTTGFCIDNTAPKVNVKKNQKYEKGIKLIFSDLCGVRWAKLDGKKIKSGTKVTMKGKHQLVVMDKAGNKKSISFVIR